MIIFYRSATEGGPKTRIKFFFEALFVQKIAHSLARSDFSLFAGEILSNFHRTYIPGEDTTSDIFEPDPTNGEGLSNNYIEKKRLLFDELICN